MSFIYMRWWVQAAKMLKINSRAAICDTLFLLSSQSNRDIWTCDLNEWIGQTLGQRAIMYYFENYLTMDNGDTKWRQSLCLTLSCKFFHFYFSYRRNGCILHSGVHQSFERLPGNSWQLNKLENIKEVTFKHYFIK